MANLKEQEIFEEGIYQWETSDPLMGGENGIDNLPLRQLANRTRWLKKSVEEAARSLGESKLDKAGGTLTGALLAAVGTTAGKGYAFDRDSDTGMFSPRDGVLQIMANNVVVAEFDAAEALNGTSLKNKRGDRLVLQADGNGVLYDAAGKVVWSAFATVSKNELSDGLAKKQDALGYTPLNKAGDNISGALRIKDGTGTNTGIKGTSDHDTGWEWEQDGVLKAIVNGVERLRISATAESGVVKISSAEGNYLLLQNDNKIAYYTAAHKLLWSSDAGLTKADAAATYLPQSGGTLTGALLAAVGTAAGKGYAFERDGDTGMFSPRDGVLQLMANNVVVAEFDAAEALNGTSLKNKRGDRLALQVDGNGVLYDAAGKVVRSAFETVSKNELSAKISELVGAAPESLRNLEALAAALKGNADIVQTLLDGLAKKQDLLGYTPLNKAGDTLTGALKVNGGSGTHAGIKGDVDHDTGFEWRQDGLLSGVVNGQERIRLASVSGDGTTKISSADGHYVLLQDDGKMVYYDSKHNPLFDSSRVPQIDILTGTIADGGTIPLPAGYTQEQCFWMVSTSRDNPDDIPWDIDESGRHGHYGYECTLNGRVVSCKVWFNKKRTTMGNAHPEITVGGVANYIIIGKKYGAI